MFDDAIRQFQETPRQPGARVQAPTPSTAAPAIAKIGDTRPAQDPRQLVEARLLTTQGAAHTETGNVWHHTPQLEMEIGVFMEQAYALNASGSIVIDPNIANVWAVSLAGNATISFAEPAAIPQDQIDAGRDRNRAASVVLRIILNGFEYSFSGVEMPIGTTDRLQDDANRDKWVADWWGGPELGSHWDLQLVASSYGTA